MQHKTKLNAGTSDPTDGKERFEWKTGYADQAVKEIRLESLYLYFLLMLSHFLLFANWKGWICILFDVQPEYACTLKKYVYYAGSGLLGGVAFGIKYFYRVVARGYWHQDRRLWRMMSPFLGMTIALIIGTMIEASLFNSTKRIFSNAGYISIGFLTGYFADLAVGKMYEIATVIFGRSATEKTEDGK